MTINNNLYILLYSKQSSCSYNLNQEYESQDRPILLRRKSSNNINKSRQKKD